MADPVMRPVKTDGRSSAASATSSRAAANLSMDRLYRKRAIDRENQRVLRQKNKTRLAELEAQVADLTAQLAERTRHDAVLDVAAVSRTAASSQSSLAGVIASLQTLQASLGALGGQASVDSVHPAHPAHPDPSGSDTSHTHSASASARSVASTTPGSSPVEAKARHTTHETRTTRVPPDAWAAGAQVTLPVDDVPRPSDFSIDIRFLRGDESVVAPSDAPDAPDAPDATCSARKDDRAHRHHAEAAVYASARHEANRLRHAVGASPVWAVTPAYVPPTSKMDELLSLRPGYAADRDHDRSLVRLPPISHIAHLVRDVRDVRALPAPPLTSPTSPTPPTPTPTSTLTDTAFASTAAVTQKVAETLAGYATPERTALLYTTCLYLRWLAAPSQQHYDAIPDFLRPTAAQLVVPHPFWVDTVAWPLARDRLLAHFDYTQSHTFADIVTRTFSVNWPYPVDAILQRNGTAFVVSGAFVQHVRDPANWSVGPELVDAFGFLDGAVNVRR